MSEEEQEEKEFKLPKIDFNLKTEPPKGKNWIFKIVDWGLIIALIIVILILIGQKTYCHTDPVICKGEQCYIGTCENEVTKWTQTPTTQNNPLKLDFGNEEKSKS